MLPTSGSNHVYMYIKNSYDYNGPYHYGALPGVLQHAVLCENSECLS